MASYVSGPSALYSFSQNFVHLTAFRPVRSSLLSIRLTHWCMPGDSGECRQTLLDFSDACWTARWFHDSDATLCVGQKKYSNYPDAVQQMTISLLDINNVYFFIKVTHQAVEKKNWRYTIQGPISSFSRDHSAYRSFPYTHVITLPIAHSLTLTSFLWVARSTRPLYSDRCHSYVHSGRCWEKYKAQYTI